MSTFDNSFIPQGYTPDEIWKLNSIYNQANPQPTVPYIGDKGDYKYTDKATFALMLAGDPERYSTRESAILQASASTVQSHYGGGESNSFGGKNNFRLNNRGVDDQLDNLGLSDLAKESIRILNGVAFNQTIFNREAIDLAGFGQRPAVAMGSTGQDDAAVTLGDVAAITPPGIVRDIITTGSSRFWNNANLQGGRNSIVDGLRAQYDGDKKQMVGALIRMGSVGESTLAQINAGEITLDQVLEDHENSGISDGVKRMSSVMNKLPASVALQVHESGLTGWSAEAYAYELLNASGTKAAGQLYRGENTEEAMALMLALIEVNGPDAYRDTMATVYDAKFDRSTAWESLDDSWKGVLTRAGHTEENFLADAGNVNNYIAYGLRAKELFANAAGREMREHRFSEGLHNGWANWTRRLTDTFRVDVGKDPYAMYFLQAVPFAVGAGFAFSGGAAATVGTNVGRVMAFSAIDGLIAGAGEGVLMSMAQQGQSFYAGRNESPFDHSTTIGDGLLYGAMGGIAGGLLGGGIAGLPSMFNKTSRGIGDLSRYVSSKADNALVAGGFESAGVQRARNRIAVRDATSDQILGIRPFTNIENEGVRLRLIAGDISAVDAIEESLGQGWVTGKANQVLAQVDSANLERHGVSALEVVDAVFGIQKQLGGKDKISADNLSELLSLYIKRANKNKRLPTVDGKLPSRVKLLDDAVAARSNADNQHWVGGTGTAEMSVKELAEFKNVLIRKARAGVAMTQAETSKFIRGIYSLRDGRSRKAAAKLLDSVIMTTEDGTARRLTSKELGEVRGRLAKSDAVSKQARKSKLFKKIRRMETMLNMVDNERTIGIARKYGITPQTVKKFIEEYYQAIGSEGALKALRQKKNYAPVWDFLAEANADNKLNMQIDEAIEGAYSWEKFLQSDEMSAVREANELRKKIAADQRTIRRDLLNNKTEGSTLGELTAKLKEGLSEAADKLRKIERKLGVGMSRAAAMDAVEARANSNIPMNLLHPDERSSRLSTAFQRLSDRANGDKAASSTDSRNAGWIRSILKGTSLGRAIEEKLSAIVVYPQAQQRLFRHRWTTVRGVAQFISGQHISSRGFSNSMDFMSIESIVESAKREAVPYLLWRRTLDRRLGRDGSRKADSEMLRLRQTGAFVKGGDWIDQVSPEVRRLYADNGGDKALREDLLRSNDLLTDLYSRSLAEMQETGMGMGGNALDPRRFIVNRIGGGLNSKNVANFLGSFVPLRQKQLLKNGATIDFDTFVSIGWIRALDVEDGADGKVIRNFEIPIDSPFAGNSVASVRKLLSNNLNLDELDGTLRSAAREGAGIIERIGRDVSFRDIYRGQEVLGNIKNAPVRETANQNTSTRAAAEAIAGTVEDLNDMIRARNALALIPEAYRTPAQRTLATQLDDAIYKTQAKRNRIAAAQMLGTDSSVVKRANISLEEQAINANDDVLYRGLSDGHDALVTRLDNLLAEGLMTEDAKRLVMMAFGDVDPSKLMGMAMYRLDVTDGLEYKGSAVSKDGRRAYTGLIKLRDVLQYGDNADMDIAETFIHEVAHIAFLSASPKMQRTLQALFEQSKNGDNSIVSLFKEVGVDVAYAFQDVHEFTAALAEVALLSNRIVNTTKATSTFMESMKQFFVKLLKNFMIVPENKSAAMRTMGRDIPELRNAIKNIFAQVEDDAAATGVIRKYNLSKRMRSMKDSDVDEYGHIAFKADLGPLERELEQAKILRNTIKGSSLTEDETAKLVNMEQKNAAGPFLTEAEKTEMRELQSRQLDIQFSLREAEKKLGDAEKKLGDAKNKLAKESKPPKEIIEAEENLIASVEPKRNLAIGTPPPSKQKLMPDDPLPKKGQLNPNTVKTKIEMILNDLKEDKNWLGLDIEQKWEVVEYQMANKFGPNSQSKMSAVITNEPFRLKQEKLFDLENTSSDVERITQLSEYLRRKIKNITDREVDYNSQSERKLRADGRLKSSTAFDGTTLDTAAKESTESLPTRESALKSLNDSFEWLSGIAEDAATTADQRLLVIALIRHKAMLRAALIDPQQFLAVNSKTGLLSARKLTQIEKELWTGPRTKNKEGVLVPSNTLSHHADRLVEAQQQALRDAGYGKDVVNEVNVSNTTRTTKSKKPRSMLTVKEANDIEKVLDGARVKYNTKVAAEIETMRVTVRDDAVSNHPASVNANDAVANGSKGPLLHSAKTGDELTSDADSMSRQDFIDSTNPKTKSESDAARDFHAALHSEDYPFPGYTKHTTEALHYVIDNFDGDGTAMARQLTESQEGGDGSFFKELVDLHARRKAETRAAAALEAETAADIPARVPEPEKRAARPIADGLLVDRYKELQKLREIDDEMSSIRMDIETLIPESNTVGGSKEVQDLRVLLLDAIKRNDVAEEAYGQWRNKFSTYDEKTNIQSDNPELFAAWEKAEQELRAAANNLRSQQRKDAELVKFLDDQLDALKIKRDLESEEAMERIQAEAAMREAEAAEAAAVRVPESDEAPVARMDDADDEAPEVRDTAAELNADVDRLEAALEAARVRVEEGNWPPPGSIAARDRVWFPYSPTKIDDDSVDRAYVFYNQEGEPVFVSHTVDEETLPDGSRQRVMFVDFESADATGEVSAYANTNSGDARAVIRAAFSKAEDDAREMGVNIIRFSRADSEGSNIGGVKIYKRLVEEAYPNRVVYASKPYGGNPQLAITLDNTNPMLSPTDVLPTDRSYYLLTDGRVRTIIREQTDWPIDLTLKGVYLRNAIDAYLSENLSELGDNIPVWKNAPRAVEAEAPTTPRVEAPAPKAEAPTAEAPRVETPMALKAEADLAAARSKYTQEQLAEGNTTEIRDLKNYVVETKESIDIVTSKIQALEAEKAEFKKNTARNSDKAKYDEQISKFDNRINELDGMLSKYKEELTTVPKEIEVLVAADKSRLNKAKAEYTRAEQAEARAKAAAEAPAPKAEAPTAEAPRVDAGDGAPPIPPKPTARGAAGDGEGADDLIAIKNRIRERLEQYRAEQGADTEYAKALRESLSRKVPDEGDKVVVNASHRLASNGNLRSIYNDALNGDTSILHKDWVDSNGAISGLTHDGRRYLDNQGGNYSSGSANDLVGREIRVREMSRPNPFENRRFHDIDFDTEEGNALARLFSDSTDSSTMVRDFAVGALSSIRIQQAVNQLTGMTGGKYGMPELLTDFANILDKEVKGEARLGGKGYRTVDTEQTKEVKELLMSMQDLYMRARGHNPGTAEGRGRPLNRGTRIARNLTQSMLGGKFALSVLFVEAPLGVLRASGLNPFKLAQNTGIIMASLAESAVVGTTAYKPVQKFLSGFGITKKISAETLDDMTHAMDSMTSSSLNRMTSGGQDEIANEALLFSFRDRIKAHIKNIKGDPDRRGESSMGTKILDWIEGTTAAGADMTGMLSFMQPVTKAVRDVAENQGKAVFLKHVPGLRKVAEELAELGDDVINTEAIVRIARKHGVPQQVAVLASRTKLLSNGGAYLDRLGTLMTDLKFGKEASAGRDFSLNILQSKIYDSADEARATGLGLMFNEAAAKTEVMDRELLVSVNDFLQQFIGDFSPELRGTMRFGGENPVVDMLYQLLGYPIAAYQALVQNGIQTRGVTMSAGILVALAGLEYSNRNLQRVINAKNEEQRQAALAKLTRMYTLQPTKDDMVEVIAAYGTTSPLFGAIGQHLRGLVGNPIMRAAGHDERLFPHSPFTGPAVGMVQKVYGNINKTLGGVGTYARSGDLKPLQAGAGGLTEDLVKILTPLNSFALGGDRIPEAFSSLLVGAGVASNSASSTMAGPSHPLVRANGYNSKDPYAWTRADFSPDGISGFTPNLKPVIAPEDLEPIPEPAPQRANPRTKVPAQAVSGVDAVLRNNGPLKAPDSLLN